MATIDQQFVEYIVKTLVSNPDKVVVERSIDERGVLLALTVAPEDVGRVIGKRGVTAQSIRMLLRALGTKQDARYNLKIVNTDDDDRPAGRRGAQNDYDANRGAHDAEDIANTDEAEPEIEETVEVEEDTDEDTPEESSELAEKTRAELADLDDLDI